MAVQGLFLIHQRKFEIPTLKDIHPMANMKAPPGHSEKAQDIEVKKVIEEEKENDVEDDVSNDKALETDEPEEI